MARARLDMIDYMTRVNGPVEEVFAHFSEVDKWHDWARPIQRARVLSRNGLRQGARVEFVTDMFPWEIPLGAKVLRYEPNRLVEWGLVTRFGRVIHRFEFSEIDNRSSSVRHVEFGEGLFARLLRPMAARIESFDRRWADDLVAAFANGAA